MAATQFIQPNIGQLMTFKLEGPNYITWVNQIVPILKTNDLMGFVDGSEPCPSKFLVDDKGIVTTTLSPEFILWTKKDQFVLSWINSTLTEKVMASTFSVTNAQQIWESLSTRFSSHSRTRISHLQRQLQSLRQGSKGCTEYISDAKQLAAQLAAVKQPVTDDALIGYVVGGLNSSFNPVITSLSVATRYKSLTFDEFNEELLSYESLLDGQSQTSVDGSNTFAMFSSKTNPHQFNRKYKPPGRSYSRPFSNPKPISPTTPKSNPNPNTFPAPKSPCQICGKLSHKALDCFHRMDHAFQGRHPPAQLAAMVAQSNPASSTNPWFVDSAANQHITSNLENLSLQQPYLGSDNVAVGNGTGLQIQNTGSMHFHTPQSTFQLSKVLHCPQAYANLLSINQFCHDNSCFFILTDSNYFVKDNHTGLTLLAGKSEGGLYPIHLNSFSVNKQHALTALLGVKTSAAVWHSRLGHTSPQVLSQLLHQFSLPVSGVKHLDGVCEPCQLGKSKQLPFQASTRISSCPLDLIHSDVWSCSTKSMNGCQYYVLFIDDFSRFTWLYPIHNKSDVFSIFVKFKSIVENQFSCSIKQFQSDGGGEFISNQFKNFFANNGIFHRISCPHTPQQNGLAERKHRHIMEMGLSLLAQSHLAPIFWVDAFLTSIFIINRLPTSILGNVSPYFKLLNKSPDYSLFRSFGCSCFPLLRPYSTNKLMFRSKHCIFLGYSSNHQGYRCLDPVSRKVYVSRHVVFDENRFPAKQGILSPTAPAPPSFSPTIALPPHPSPISIDEPSILPIVPTTGSPSCSSMSPIPQPVSPLSNQLSSNCTTSILHLDDSAQSSSISPSSDLHIPESSNPHVSLTSHPLASPIPSLPTNTLAIIPHHPMVTRSQTGHSKPRDFSDYKVLFSSKHPLCALTSVSVPAEPTCYSQAMLSPKWRAAMGDEFDALLANATWSLCPRPARHNIIRNKWVFKIKQKQDGTIDRYKARLVAKGFDQESGMDYTETFSPVVKTSTIRVILALAVQFNWCVRQLDVSNAFLHGHLLEEVYMEQPKGFIDSRFPSHVCRLHKSLYGLKQAPRAWFTRLSQTLLDIGFVSSSVDSSLFLFHHGNVHLYFLVYVDDLLVTGTSTPHIVTVIKQLQQVFKLKDLGDLSFFLGIQAIRSSQGLHLRQAKYISDLLSKSKMVGAKPYSSPCLAGTKMSISDGDPLSLTDATTYRQTVGALQYCTLTRPDIAFSVNQLCQHMHNPSTHHWTAAKRVLRYLKGTIDHGLWYTKGPLILQAFCDSDWAGDPDDRRSTTGFGILLGSSIISWIAKKQPVVARSSTEAEYRAMAVATTDLFWLRMLFKDLGIPLFSTPVLWCDNIGALALASNPVYHARTKHVEVDYHFIREKVINRDISIKYISTHDQPADIFTKGLSSTRFGFLRDKLMVCSVPISLRGAVSITPSRDLCEESLQDTKST
jgi:hypothetical protein